VKAQMAATGSGADPSMEMLDRVAAPAAQFVAEMDRTEGAFRFQVRRGAQQGEALPAPGRDELLGLVPPGSRWTEALGWSAYFGWPLVAAGRHYWAVGAEEVRARPSGGDGAGAYPVVRVYLHLAPPVAILEELAGTLDEAGRRGGRPDLVEAGVVVFAMTGTTPDACRVEQAAILRQAAAACAAGGTPLFRTAVLAEAEALPLAAFPRRLPRGVDRCFLGVPDVLSRTFSARARTVLYLRAFWRPR
jgi:hypothetical protein